MGCENVNYIQLVYDRMKLIGTTHKNDEFIAHPSNYQYFNEELQHEISCQ